MDWDAATAVIVRRPNIGRLCADLSVKTRKANGKSGRTGLLGNDSCLNGAPLATRRRRQAHLRTAFRKISRLRPAGSQQPSSEKAKENFEEAGSG